MKTISLFLLLLTTSLAVFGKGSNPEESIFKSRIQPILESRCIGCHSCFNAPCQLNMQSFEGLDRGATHLNIYDGLRLKSVLPSRMFIDAKNTEEWREKGFYPVLNSKKSEDNLFLEHLRIRIQNKDYFTTKTVESSMICSQDISQTKSLTGSNKDIGMPFGFPALTESEFRDLESWIVSGSPGPKENSQVNSKFATGIKQWQEFFNSKDPRRRLVARYLFEHLFLAHLYFEGSEDQFFRLVRSKTNCEEDIQEISTRRPNDDPGTENFFYCLKPVKGPVVLKTHIPYLISTKKLERIKDLFFKTNWNLTSLPSYQADTAQNPFVAFAAIPARARYQFLLDDAQYHVMTFIKGPVCNGTNAVNSIQEQFYTFFMDPQSDPMIDPAFEKSSRDLLLLPGAFGSDVDPIETPKLMSQLTDHREKFRKYKAIWLKQFKAKGIGLNDIWDGDKTNPNAILTILRHDDNAVVIKGAVGHLPKTVFLLDYSLFERLVYNLVVNFDVFGNVGHQLLTRIYMDYIRMEAEENFLLLLPPEKRQIYRNAWYQGVLTEAKMKYLFPPVLKGEPTAVPYKSMEKPKTQLIEMLIGMMTPSVHGPGDSLNWRELHPPGVTLPKLNLHEQELRKIVSIRSMGNLPFARYFPETSYIIIRKKNKIENVYSVMHNREFQNISWIIGEFTRRAPHEDTLTIKEGFWIPYPVMLFDVDQSSLPQFVSDIRSIKTRFDFPGLVEKYGVLARQERFWSVWDDLHQYMKQTQGVEFGYLDLTRYDRSY